MGLVVGVWIARYLGPEEFGLISYSKAFVGFFAVIATLGFNNIVVRDLVKDPEQANLILGTVALLQFLGGCMAFALMVWAIDLARPDDARTRLVVMIIGSAMFFKATEVATYWFEAKIQSKYVVWANNGVFLAFAAVNVSLILLDAPLIAFVWAMFAEAALSSLAVLAMFVRVGPGLMNLRVHFKRALTLLKDSWPLILSGLTIMIYMRVDEIMLGQMIGDEAVGIYSVAVRVSEVWYFIPTSIVASVFPAIIDAKKQSEVLYYQRLQQLYDLMVILSLVIAIPMTFLSDWFVGVLFGAVYQEAGAVLAIHIWASVFIFLGMASGRWFIVENRPMLSLQRTAFGAIVNVALNLALIPDFGVVGAAWATVISYSITAFFYDMFQKETKNMYTMKIASFNVIRLLSKSCLYQRFPQSVLRLPRRLVCALYRRLKRSFA